MSAIVSYLERNRVPTISRDTFTRVQMDEEAKSRSDQPSFHVFAEGQLSDLRGQIYNVAAGASWVRPHDRCPGHVFIVTGLTGRADAEVDGCVLTLVPFTQLVVLPGVPCRLNALCDASFQVISLLGISPVG